MSAQRAAVANVLGALALAITTELDRTAAAIGCSHSDLAALSALDQFLDGGSIDKLRDVLGLSHSGAVRLVERLADAGLLTREAGIDGRTRSIKLTQRGRRTARAAADQRADYLDSLLGDLPATELAQLQALLKRVAGGVVQLKDGGPWICRRCDLTACGRHKGRCPVATAAADKYGTPVASPPRRWESR